MKRLPIILILSFTFLQVFIIWVFGYTPYPDSNNYIDIAIESVNHGQAYPVKELINEYGFLWNIGAINATAYSWWLFHSITPLLIFYAFLKGVTSWLFYSLVKTMTTQHIAIIALIIYFLYPANYGEASSTLSELPFMFFVMSGLYAGIVHQRYFMGGLLIAVANYFRPMGLVFILALVMFLLINYRKQIIYLISGYAAMILIIGFINQYRTGLFLYQAKTGWMNLAVKSYNSSNPKEWSYDPQQVIHYDNWNVSQKDSAWQSQFTEWVFCHPSEYVKRMPEKLLYTYVSDNVNLCTFLPDKQQRQAHNNLYGEISMPTLYQQFPHYTPIQWLTIINLLFYYLIIILSLLSLRNYQYKTHMLSISVIVIGTAFLLVFGHGESRFHIPFMPFFIIMAATFLNIVYRKTLRTLHVPSGE